MSESSTSPLIHQIAVELKYRRGMVFFDRCGSLVLKLEDELKAPFIADVPRMEAGELRSPSEFLTVNFGPKRFAVSQSHVDTVARVENVAPRSWSHVAETLNVGGQVIRQGMRVWIYWSSKTEEDGYERLRKSGFIETTSLWSKTFGVPRKVTVSAVSNDFQGSKLRAELSVVKFSTEDQPLRDDIVRRYASKSAIMLDLDFEVGDEAETFSVGSGVLKQFIRNSMDSARNISRIVGAELNLTGLP
jgi:hypothetical protein